MAKVIPVVLTNRHAKIVGHYSSDRLLPYWSFSVPNYRFMRNRFPGWDGRIKFLKYDKVPAGLFRATRRQIEDEQRIKFRIVRKEYRDVRTSEKRRIKSDRPYQNDCVDKMLSAIRRGGGIILNATGSGKTRIAAMFCSAVRGQIIFIVDQLDLLRQGKRELENTLGEKIGFVGDSVYSPERVTVATVQTIARHSNDPKFREWLDSVEVLLIDELHVQMAKRNFKSVERIEPIACFGLTATLALTQKPVRLRAFALCGPVLYEYPIERGMKEGVLTKGAVLRILFRNEVDKRASTHQQYVDCITDNAVRNAIVSRLARAAVKKGKYVIVLVQQIQHLKNLSKRLKDVPHRLVYGKKEVAEREQYTKKFEKGDVRLIIASQVFKKGVDIKRVDVIIDAAGMLSANDAIQKFGRGVRRHEDKDVLMYFDIADYGEKKYVRYKQSYEYNRFHKAANKRKRAFKQAGIPTADYQWSADNSSFDILKAMQKQINKLSRRKDERV